jgi:hypothetical protein
MCDMHQIIKKYKQIIKTCKQIINIIQKYYKLSEYYTKTTVWKFRPPINCAQFSKQSEYSYPKQHDRI